MRESMLTGGQMARHCCDYCRGGYHYRNPGLYHQLFVLWNPVLQRLL